MCSWILKKIKEIESSLPADDCWFFKPAHFLHLLCQSVYNFDVLSKLVFIMTP